MNQAWWYNPFRTFQTNLREIDAGLDVEAVLDAIEAYGADTWLLSVGGIVANYPSRLSSQTVNPALAERGSGDLIGDAVTAAARRGIRVLGRMDFSKIDARRAEEHPEWCFVSPEGSPQIYNGYRSVCPSGDYYQHRMFDVVAEVLQRYDLGGFFFNWMSFNEFDYSRTYWGVCHCESCLVGFRAFAPGVPHPSGPDSPGYRTWQAFTDQVLGELQQRMREHIRALNSGAAYIQGDRGDITFHEANNAVGRPLWHHHTAEMVSAARSGEADRPVFVNAVGFVDMPYRWAGEDPNHFAQFLLQAIAHGAQPSTYIMGTPADSPFRALEAGGEVTRFHRDHEDLYAGLVSAARVALVRGSRPEPATAAARQSEFRGSYLSLLERHVPFDVLRQDQLGSLEADRYALVILPDLGALAAEEVAALERVLAAGGAVVASGDSAWQDGVLQLGGGTALAEHRATYRTEEAVRSLHLAVGEPEGDFTPVVGGFEVLEPAEGVETDWHVLGRALYGPPEKCHGHEATSHPGWISRDVGPGQLAVLPWRPGLVYRELGLSRVRDAWVDKILGLARVPLQVETDLPEQVQFVLGRTPHADVLHLLNRSGDAPQRFLRPVPLAAGRVRIPAEQEPASVRARVSDAELAWSWQDGVLEIQTPPLGLFEVLETQWHNK
ncbi:alpha-amylase family protein [Bogoriella caseilytica]|uniref:Putative glycosyl hydrolase-like family 6 (GHL6) protein n=1 Tax=Bogoriella caseilytica TaxID=56055 RepID=A0A3N2BB03_9MICO|nr:alpha-amylase family protein [Bogoriella caseilytica]ROR72436.1 putative glycosyl hydrolase-like family 6 (GHL6) protein [Bogoriella caseilytica]